MFDQMWKKIRGGGGANDTFKALKFDMLCYSEHGRKETETISLLTSLYEYNNDE